MTVFNTSPNNYLTQPLFLGPELGIARYENVKYSWIDQLTEQQHGFFWRPQEINLYADEKDFKNLSLAEQHIFKSNLQRQILLDSVQGRGPTEILGPICSNPELENFITAWAFFETIHSRSYTHIIRRIYSDPSKIFDEILDIPEIIDCAKDISKYYDNLSLTIKTSKDHYEIKKALWLCLNAINALEGIRFYVSFACSWAFAELKVMEGNAKIIKLIARDENLHLAFTQHLLRTLVKDDPDMVLVKEETKEEVKEIFQKVVEQEKLWAKYLFKDGSIIGLNEDILCQYVEWIAAKRMKIIGVDHSYSVKNNPLPWTEKWISSEKVQDAPQEVNLSSYVVGGVDNDISNMEFDIDL